MNLLDTIEDKAMTDGSYAIAFALLKCAKAQQELADAMDQIGMNRAGVGNHAPGCLEKIAIILEEMNNAR